MSAAAPAQPAPTAGHGLDRVSTGLLVALAASFALLPIKLDRLWGLPAHPLLLHAPVILIPILAMAVVAGVARPAWRRRYGVGVAALAIVALGSTFLAAGAGEKFKDQRDAMRARFGGGEDPALHRHAELAGTLRVIMVVAVIAIVALVVLDRMARAIPAAAITGLAVAALITSLLAGVWTVRTGHAGAKVTWGERGGPGGAGNGPRGGGPPGDARRPPGP
jgi:hypothetical protein